MVAEEGEGGRGRGREGGGLAALLCLLSGAVLHEKGEEKEGNDERKKFGGGRGKLQPKFQP